MTPDERLWSAIRLDKPDRVPLLPTLLPEPAAGLSGVSMARIAADNQVALEAVFRVFDEYGGWENPYPASYAPIELQAFGAQPMKMRIPGKDLADDVPWQIVEQEILLPSDYDTITEVGFEEFYDQDYLWRITDLRPDEVPAHRQNLMAGMGRFLQECSERDTKPFFIGNGLHPFFALSLMRSLVPFTQDLYGNPEPVERALRRMTTDFIDRQRDLVQMSGINLCLLVEERASGAFYSPAIFERFWWPYTREIVEAFWAEGIVTVFHLDQCWDLNLRYFKELPRGSAVLELDGTTDIFAAKKTLGGHLCLKGDVGAASLAIGQPEEVVAYCKRLIDEVGADGGFILGSGCSVPPNVQPENFRAMVDTAKTYELTRS